MKVINLFAGPGAGKSTLAAGIFSQLKLAGFNCELITEYAKDLTWEERQKTFEDQWYVTFKQLHRLKRLIGKVDWAITDSPILLGTIYKLEPNPYFLRTLYWEFNNFYNYNIFVNRPNRFSRVGRRETLDEAKLLDEKVKALEVTFHKTVSSNSDGIQEIVNEIISNQ